MIVYLVISILYSDMTMTSKLFRFVNFISSKENGGFVEKSLVSVLTHLTFVSKRKTMCSVISKRGTRQVRNK